VAVAPRGCCETEKPTAADKVGHPSAVDMGDTAGLVLPDFAASNSGVEVAAVEPSNVAKSFAVARYAAESCAVVRSANRVDAGRVHPKGEDTARRNRLRSKSHAASLLRRVYTFPHSLCLSAPAVLTQTTANTPSRRCWDCR